MKVTPPPFQASRHPPNHTCNLIPHVIKQKRNGKWHPLQQPHQDIFLYTSCVMSFNRKKTFLFYRP